MKQVAAVVPFDDSQGFSTLDERKDLPLDFRITSFSWIWKLLHRVSECFHMDDGLMRRAAKEEGKGEVGENWSEAKKTLVRRTGRGRWRNTRTWVWSGKEVMGSSSDVSTRRLDRWDLQRIQQQTRKLKIIIIQQENVGSEK